MERGHILLKDRPAEKQGAWPLPNVPVVKRVTLANALKGELLIKIPRDNIVGRSDGAKPHNYRLVKNEAISLRAEDDHVAPLSNHEFLLLEAIRSPLARYEVFLSDKVDWGLDLKLDDIVNVAIPGKVPTSNVRVSAIVRHAGPITDCPGFFFGVEIMDKAYRGYGTTDGTFGGARYFTCEDNCGLFVALDRISKVKDHGSTHTEPSREGQSQQHKHQYDLRSKPEGSTKSSVNTESQFKVGERVIVYNKKNVAIHGTVQWAGVVSDGKELQVLTVGIETDIAVTKEDFEDTISMRSHTFKVSASHHGRVYLQEIFVVRGKEGGQEPNSHEQPLNHEQFLRREKLRHHEQPLNREHPLRHEQPSNPVSNFNAQHRGKLAQTYGYKSEAEMLHEQSEALRKAEQEAKEFEEIQKAVQIDIDIDKQREALRDIEEKKQAAAVAVAKLQRPSSGSKTSGVNNAPHFGSQRSFPGSHQSSGSAATRTPYARQHSNCDVKHLYDIPDDVHAQFDTAQAQHGARGYNQGQQQPPSQYISPESTAWSQTSSHEARRQHGTTGMPLAKQQGSPQPFPGLGIGSTVQVFDPPRYGVIRWIGTLQSFQGLVAGIELEEYMDDCGDGIWEETRHFTCTPGKGFFCPLANVKPDHRSNESATATTSTLKNLAIQEEKEHLVQECSLLRQQLSEQRQSKEHLEWEFSLLQQHLSQQNQKLQQEYTELERQLSHVSEQHQQEKKEKLNLQRLFHEEKRHFQEECAAMQQQVVQQREAATLVEARYCQEIKDLQHRLETAHAEMQQLCPSPHTQVLIQDIDPWKVSRSEVQILSEMGRGAWGYVAKGRFRGQLVAVKSPHPEILDKHTTERLRREVSIMAQVRHPNLLRIIAAVFDNQVPHLPPLIVTELLDMNLRAAYQNSQLSGASRVSIFRDVAYALHYLHEHQEPIIHRDVSAPNVLLEELPNGMFKAKVSDFGSANLAKLAQTLAEGAIIYAAPETFPPRDLHSPPPPQTTKIDVYSYGILLCEVITCQLPDPQRLWSMLQEVKRQWTFMHDLIVSCTQHSPGDRLTMAQVLDKLNQLPRAKPRH